MHEIGGEGMGPGDAKRVSPSRRIGGCMIRAWTIIRGRAKEPWPLGNELLRLQYPIFPTMKDARAFAHNYIAAFEKPRIVRCQIRIEGK